MHSMNANVVAMKQAERERLAADVERFIASGGKPYQAAPNECAEWGLQMSYDSKFLEKSRKRGTIAGHRSRGIHHD